MGQLFERLQVEPLIGGATFGTFAAADFSTQRNAIHRFR